MSWWHELCKIIKVIKSIGFTALRWTFFSFSAPTPTSKGSWGIGIRNGKHSVRFFLLFFKKKNYLYKSLGISYSPKQYRNRMTRRCKWLEEQEFKTGYNLKCLGKKYMPSIFISSPLSSFVCKAQVASMASFPILISSKIWRIQLSDLRHSMDCWRTCWASQSQMSRHCLEAMKSYPQHDCSQVTYWRACKETKERQIRVDVKSALPDRKQLSHRGCPANQAKKTLKKCQNRGWNYSGTMLWKGRSFLSDKCTPSPSLPG